MSEGTADALWGGRLTLWQPARGEGRNLGEVELTIAHVFSWSAPSSAAKATFRAA